MLEDYRTMEELLEVERDLCDRLDEQINDVTELYRNEIVNVKQVDHPPLYNCTSVTKVVGVTHA